VLGREFKNVLSGLNPEKRIVELIYADQDFIRKLSLEACSKMKRSGSTFIARLNDEGYVKNIGGSVTTQLNIIQRLNGKKINTFEIGELKSTYEGRIDLVADIIVTCDCIKDKKGLHPVGLIVLPSMHLYYKYSSHLTTRKKYGNLDKNVESDFTFLQEILVDIITFERE